MPRRPRHHYGFERGLFRETVLASTLAIFTNAFEFLAAFLLWPATAVFAFLMHMLWPGSFYVICFLLVTPVILGAMMWRLSPPHDQGMPIHITTVAGLTSAILIFIDVFGWTKPAIFAVVCGVPVMCLTLAMHISMRNKKAKGLDHIFEQAGVPGATMTIHRHDEYDDESELVD